MGQAAPNPYPPAEPPGSPRTPATQHAVPEWIVRDPMYAKLPQSVRITLQAIADHCEAPDADDSLLYGFGGHTLIAAVGCSRSTFWRHVGRLAAAGFLVTLRRGSGLGNYSNIYAIPGRPGALEYRRARRRMQRMLEVRPGVYHPHVVEPGQQVPLFPPADASAETPSSTARSPPDHRRDSDTTPCQDDTRAPQNGARAPQRAPQNGARAPQNEAPPDLVASGLVERTRSGVVHDEKRGRKLRPGRRPAGHRGPWLGDLTVSDLRDTGRLLELRDQAIGCGWIGSSEADRLKLVAAAEHALRVATANPCGLFYSTLRAQTWLYIAQADEDAAARRLRAVDAPESPARARPRETSEIDRREESDAAGAQSLSDDGQFAGGFLAALRQVGYRGDPWRAVKGRHPEWTPERWAQAVEDYQAARDAAGGK